MLSQTQYLLRSKTDGQYLVARSPTATGEIQYLLIFGEYADALTYVNTHGPELIDRFAVESVLVTQLKGILERWGFKGLGMVKDPLLPQIEFLTKD